MDVTRANELYCSSDTLSFQITVGSHGITVPQKGGELTLLGRDSFVITYASTNGYLSTTADVPIARI